MRETDEEGDSDRESDGLKFTNKCDAGPTEMNRYADDDNRGDILLELK